MCVRHGLQEVQAEKEAKRADKLAKREAKRAASMRAENTPPVAVTAAAPIAANMDGLPVVRAVPMSDDRCAPQSRCRILHALLLRSVSIRLQPDVLVDWARSILASVAHEKRIVWSACDRRVIYLEDTQVMHANRCLSLSTFSTQGIYCGSVALISSSGSFFVFVSSKIFICSLALSCSIGSNFLFLYSSSLFLLVAHNVANPVPEPVVLNFSALLGLCLRCERLPDVQSLLCFLVFTTVFWVCTVV